MPTGIYSINSVVSAKNSKQINSDNSSHAKNNSYNHTIHYSSNTSGLLG